MPTEMNTGSDASLDEAIESRYNNRVPQVSAGEKTAGTETAARRFAPQDIHDMIDTHAAGGGGGIANVVEDTTPQLGGPLDMNGNNIGGVTPTEIGYSSGVTSSIQTQLDAKAALTALANYLALTGGTLSGNLNADGNVTITNANPLLQMVDSDAPADQQKIRMAVQSDVLLFSRRNDDDTEREVSARVDLAGTTSPDALTLMTREKGDARYADDAATVSQVEAEAGTLTDVRRWTPQRVAQAIAALAPGAAGGDAWSDPVDSDITFDGDGTRSIGSAAARAASVHTDSLDLNGTTMDGAAMSAPGADAIMGYDLSATQTIFYTIGNGLSTSGTTFSADVESVAGLTGAISASGLRTALNVADGAEANAVDSVAGETGAIGAGALRTALNVADGAEVNTIDSDPTGVTGADQVTNVMSLTQAEYDAIGTKNASTTYYITDA